jgi:hypothetical protein
MTPPADKPNNKDRATGTIALNNTAPVDKDDTLTFDWSISVLSGREYPMIILWVHTPDGVVLYGRMDHPDANPPWVIGAGSSPWLDPNNPYYGDNAIGHAELWVYVPFRQQDATNVYMVAETPEFEVTW